MNLFNTLLDFPESAVFAIVNKVDKRVYIGYSSSLMSNLGEVFGYINRGEKFGKKMKEDKDKLSLLILEATDCRNGMKLRHSFYIDMYKNNGYTLYNEVRPVRYRVRQYLHNLPDRSPAISVQLVSSGGRRIIVGVFESKTEADEFIRIHYQSEFAYEIIYSTNEISMRYIKRNDGDAE